MKLLPQTKIIPYHSPIGWLRIYMENDMVVRIVFAKQKGTYHAHVSRQVKKLLRELDIYFMGDKYRFKTNVSLRGTPFQCEVWKALGAIPYGEVRTYGDIAKQIGRPNAYRAVGSACKHNPIPIIIPCHRAVPATCKMGSALRSPGEVGEYAGGVVKKKWLLNHEWTHYS